MALPNLIIAGAPKCGTSSMFQWLADHPQAEGASTKEVRYFVDADSHVFDPSNNFATGGAAGYARFFPVSKPKAKIRLEATPVYIYQKSALNALPDLPSRPRFLFLLREPTRQILSTYRYFSNNWTYLKGGVSFAEYIELVDAGSQKLRGNELLSNAIENVRYAARLAPWRDRVGADAMRVMLLEDIERDPAAAMVDLAGWLGLDPTFYRDYGFPLENATYRARNAWLQAANVGLRGLIAKTPLYKPLRAVYRQINTSKAPRPLAPDDHAALAALRLRFEGDNQALEQMFGLDLSPWRDGAWDE